MSCGVGHRCGSDHALLWLWCTLVATAQIRPLASEPPYALGVALEKAKGQQTQQQKRVSRIMIDAFCELGNVHVCRLQSKTVFPRNDLDLDLKLCMNMDQPVQ